jgi:hypothetical protein
MLKLINKTRGNMSFLYNLIWGAPEAPAPAPAAAQPNVPAAPIPVVLQAIAQLQQLPQPASVAPELLDANNQPINAAFASEISRNAHSLPMIDLCRYIDRLVGERRLSFVSAASLIYHKMKPELHDSQNRPIDDLVFSDILQNVNVETTKVFFQFINGLVSAGRLSFKSAFWILQARVKNTPSSRMFVSWLTHNQGYFFPRASFLVLSNYIIHDGGPGFCAFVQAEASLANNRSHILNQLALCQMIPEPEPSPPPCPPTDDPVAVAPSFLPKATANVVPVITQLPHGITEKSLNEFAENVRLLAPSIARPLSCSAPNGCKYFIWWNDEVKAINMQEAQAFRIHSSNDKFSIGFPGNPATRFTCFVGSAPRLEIPGEYMVILNDAFQQTTKLRVIHDKLEEAKKAFDPASLAVILAFMKGPKGASYRFTDSQPLIKGNCLIMGNFSAWIRIRKIESPRNPSDIRYEYYLNLQHASQVGLSEKNKLGIKIEPDGSIGSLYLEGKEVPPDQIQRVLYNPESPWNQQLTTFMRDFLVRQALVSMGASHLQIHPQVLIHHPEAVLLRVAGLPGAQLPTVKFLNNDLTPGPAVDAGGPRRQMLSELFLHLLDGSSQRAIHMTADSGVPTLSTLTADGHQEREVLFNLGRMFAKCFNQDGLISGRMLPDAFFQSIKDQFALPPAQALSKNQMLQLARPLISPNMQWVLDVDQGKREATQQEKEMLESIQIPDFPYDSAVKIRQGIDQFLEDYCYKRIIATFEIVRGMRSMGVDEGKLGQLSSVMISEKIQGIPFDRADIASRIRYTGTNSVVSQKVQWLKAWILDINTPQSLVEDLLMAVTGYRTVTASTILKIDGTSAKFCSAHSCFKTLDIPIAHVSNGTPVTEEATADNLRKFINNLMLLLADPEAFDGS